jgi:hypothetical protein
MARTDQQLLLAVQRHITFKIVQQRCVGWGKHG